MSTRQPIPANLTFNTQRKGTTTFYVCLNSRFNTFLLSLRKPPDLYTQERQAELNFSMTSAVDLLV